MVWDSVQRIVVEKNPIRASQDETMTEDQIRCEFNIGSIIGEGVTETNQTTGRGSKPVSRLDN